MNAHTELFSGYRDAFVRAQDEEMGLEEFLHYCKTDRMAYASSHECVLEAIGKPTLLNTADDPRLSRIFQNRVIQQWDTFAEFHGMEETLMSLYAYFLHRRGARARQVLYLLGGRGGKSSLARSVAVRANDLYARRRTGCRRCLRRCQFSRDGARRWKTVTHPAAR
jgi:serine protein kinase